MTTPPDNPPAEIDSDEAAFEVTNSNVFALDPVARFTAAAMRDRAMSEAFRKESWRTLWRVLRHRATVPAYIVLILAWGVGGATCTTGVTADTVTDFVEAGWCECMEPPPPSPTDRSPSP